jgi:AcrR family transcriptional regulator
MEPAGKRQTVRRTRERRRARTRQRILETAEQIIAEEGPEKLSMRELAGRIEYSPAALYEYFSSKDEILEAICQEGFARLADSLSRIPGHLPAAERLVQAGLIYLEFAREYPRHYLLMFGRGRPTSNPLRTVEASEAYMLLRRIIADGINAGQFQVRPDYGLEEMTYQCWALVHGMAMLRLTLLQEGGTAIDALHRRILPAAVAGLCTP